MNPQLLSVTNLYLLAWVTLWQLCLCWAFEMPSHVHKASELGQLNFYDIPASMNVDHDSGFNVSILEGALGGSVVCSQPAVAHFYPRMADPMPSFHNLHLFEAFTDMYVAELASVTPINATALRLTGGRSEFWVEPWNVKSTLIRPGRYYLVSVAYDAELVRLSSHTYGVSAVFNIPPCEYNRFF